MRPEFDNTEDWHNRGYLPHYDAANKYQMITYRLNDSLPAGSADVPSALNESDAQKRKRIEQLMDNGYGSCILKIPAIAELVVKAWKHFDKERYELIAYVVMPNHVHVLIKTYKDWSLTKVTHSWKSFTGHEMKKILERMNYKPMAYADGTSALPAWQEEYWDRFIRDEKHYYRAIRYIHENPVKAGLCAETNDWKWSSANDEKFREDQNG